MSASWKVSLPCSKAEGEALQGDVDAFDGFASPPVLMSSEVDGSRPDEWRIDAYFDAEPDPDAIAVLARLVPSAAGVEPQVEELAPEDWVTLSQQGLEPIRAGRFFVHTPQHGDKLPAGAVAIEIDAGRAFGTGHHETTTGCLIALDRMKEAGLGFSNMLDLGTGTGLIAFAAMRLWPEAMAAASDIDPVSIEVTADNARINGVAIGGEAGALELAVAAGLDHHRLQARAPYDLIIANILAAPLIALAPAIAAALQPGGRLILAGLLQAQAADVIAAYRRHGLDESFRVDRGDWPTLVLHKQGAPGGE